VTPALALCQRWHERIECVAGLELRGEGVDLLREVRAVAQAGVRVDESGDDRAVRERHLRRVLLRVLGNLATDVEDLPIADQDGGVVEDPVLVDVDALCFDEQRSLVHRGLLDLVALGRHAECCNGEECRGE